MSNEFVLGDSTPQFSQRRELLMISLPLHITSIKVTACQLTALAGLSLLHKPKSYWNQPQRVVNQSTTTAISYFRQGGEKPREICMSDLQPPDLMLWRHETGRESQHKNEAYLLLYVAQNSIEDLKMVKEHKEELITRSIEAIRLMSEMREKVKWYRM
ncbi:hypothetical protein F5051DRAFT_413667, partial [Lentinula edodes]